MSRVHNFSAGPAALPLEVRASLADGDGSERLSITLRDLPSTVQVSAGTRQEDGSWRLSWSELKGLYLMPLPGTPERLRFKIVATAQEQSNNATAEVVRSMDLRVVPDR